MDKCIFCLPKRNELFKEVVLENDAAVVVFDNFPVSPGHLLIIPKQHFEHWFVATRAVQDGIQDLVQGAHDWLMLHHNPDGFNIGANCGKAAGQTVFHLHYHIIPRYFGDHDSPAGGIRHAVVRGEIK